MPPQTRCPNCGQDEWLQTPDTHYLPTAVRLRGGGYEADVSRGPHVSVWRCNNCMYVMQFWEPD